MYNHTIHHRQYKTAPLEFISRRSRGCSIAPFRGTCGPTSQSRFRVGKVPLSTSASHVAKYVDVYRRIIYGT